MTILDDRPGRSDGSSAAGLRILVVEDEYLVAEHIASTLEDMGYEVVGPVPTIEEAMALIGSEALDCVLLDVNLDGKSSAPIAAALAARSICFVVVTAYGDLKLADAGLDSAPRLAKPFSAQDLAATLAGAFAR
jgi:DNA-binding response OmpR family regulator